MLVGELLCQVEEHGVQLRRAPDDRLQFSPSGALPTELVAQLREHKTEILRILKEDEVFHRTGVIQSERQVFEVAREYFGLNQEGGAV
jgi:hypothetical protein